MVGDDLEALRRHIAAVWTVDVPPLGAGDVELPAAAGSTPWALYAARVAGAEVRVWRPLPPHVRAGLREQAWRALGPGGAEPGTGVVGEVVFRRGTGAAAEGAPGRARRLGPGDRGLLEAFEPGETAYWLVPARAPLFGVVEQGLLLSIAHSSRRSAQACELGINTLPAARRRGFARRCVLAWAAAVAAEGLEPLYSASWDNAPSLALAQACGYRPFARAAQVGPPQPRTPAPAPGQGG